MVRSSNSLSVKPRTKGAPETLARNETLSDFLRASDDDAKILARYRKILGGGEAQFRISLRGYLASLPARNQLPRKFRRRVRALENLFCRRRESLAEFLSSDLTAKAMHCLLRIGIHGRRHDVEPAWILGAWQLYLAHLQAIIRTHPNIADSDRATLGSIVTRLLMRDVGLVLQGYWKDAAHRLEREHERMGEAYARVSDMLSSIPQLLWSVDVASSELLFVSPSEQTVSETDDDLPLPSFGVTIVKDRGKLHRAWDTAVTGERAVAECRVRLPDGRLRWYRRTLSPYRNAEGTVTRIDGIMEDVTETKRTLRKLRALATLDPLTGLPNRSLFEDRFKQALHAAARRGREVALVMIDIDEFKRINDTLGHPAGDEVLTLLGQRLSALLRATDTVARLGGDEFAILLPDVSRGRKTAAQFTKKMLKSLSAPFLIDGHELFVRTGIGIAVYPEHGEDSSTLIRNADVALYGTKNRDVDFLFYDNAPEAKPSTHTNLAAELRRAIKRNELVLHYQPQINMQRRSVVSVEALVRWQHPQLGLLPPERFLTTAERTGSIRPLTYWALETALQQCARWRRLGWHVGVTVNVCSRVLREPSFIERTRALLRQAGLPASALELDVTENTLMTDTDRVHAALIQLGKLGTHIAIDNFGSGFSSLALLNRLSIAALKIDKPFVQGMVGDEHASTVVRSVVNLGHSLGCAVVAEGVESRAAWEALSKLDCERAQGYLIGRPMVADAIEEWFVKTSWNSGASQSSGTSAPAFAIQNQPDTSRRSLQRR